MVGTSEEERRHHRVSGRDPAREGQRDGLPGARCAHGASAGRRERDVVRDGGDEGTACAGGSVEGEGAGDDHRCAGERTEGGGGAVARGAAPGVSVPCAARRGPARF